MQGSSVCSLVESVHKHLLELICGRTKQIHNGEAGDRGSHSSPFFNCVSPEGRAVLRLCSEHEAAAWLISIFMRAARPSFLFPFHLPTLRAIADHERVPRPQCYSFLFSCIVLPSVPTFEPSSVLTIVAFLPDIFEACCGSIASDYQKRSQTLRVCLPYVSSS
jgi:hypothetical protein